MPAGTWRNEGSGLRPKNSVNFLLVSWVSRGDFSEMFVHVFSYSSWHFVLIIGWKFFFISFSWFLRTSWTLGKSSPLVLWVRPCTMLWVGKVFIAVPLFYLPWWTSQDSLCSLVSGIYYHSCGLLMLQAIFDELRTRKLWEQILCIRVTDA